MTLTDAVKAALVAQRDAIIAATADPTTLTDDAVGALLAKAAVKAVTDWVTAQAADDRRLLYRRRLEDRAGRQDGAGL